MELLLSKVKEKLSIKVKLFSVVLMLIIYPIIIIGYFGYRNYAEIMTQKTIEHSKISADRLTGLISERVDNLRNFSIQIFYDGRIYDFINKVGSPDEDSFNKYVLQQDLEKHMTSILLSKPEIESIVLRLEDSGNLYFFDRYKNAPTNSSINIEKALQAAAAEKGTPAWYVEETGSSVNIYLVKFILDISSLNETGILILKVNNDYLFDNVYSFFPDKHQNVSILGNDNIELFTLNPDDFTIPFDSITAGEVYPQIRTIPLKSDNILTITSKIPSPDWKLVLSLSSNTLLKEVRTVSGVIILLCIITLPIGLLLINVVYISVIRPLNLLIRTMHLLEKGDIGTTIKIKRMDEIGYLFRTFNKMSSEIENLINTVYKEQLAMKDAELKQLQAQITPHFLYNTLEAINWKAKISGVDEISEMVTALSSIIEANLNRSNQKLIKVEKELEYIDNYILLVKKRFGNKIGFIAEIDDAALELLIPKLIIQPLIENAIFHGLEMKKGKGTIKLTISANEEILTISVIDDGIGIDEPTLENLRKELLQEETANDTAGKIGILNVHRRIRLMYGANYGLKISSEIAKGTDIEMMLPVTSEKGDAVL